jgi:hypothetical protein
MSEKSHGGRVCEDASLRSQPVQHQRPFGVGSCDSKAFGLGDLVRATDGENERHCEALERF